jgi:type I restriction enzyme S subunit
MTRTSTFAELLDRKVLFFSDGYRTRQDQLGDDGFPILRVAEVAEGHLRVDGDEERVRREFEPNIGLKMAAAGDVILTTKGTIGRRAIVPRSFPSYVYSPQVCFFRVLDQTVVDNRYLYYWLGSPDFITKSAGLRSQTDMADYISLRDMAQLAVPLPPISEQRAIAFVLGSFDDKIDLNRRMNQTLEQIAQALFKSWFVDFDPVRAKVEGRWKKGESLPGMPADMWDLCPSEFENSEIGEIPKGWKVQPLSDVANFTRGVSYRGEDLAESDTALVSLKCAGRGGFYRKDGLKAYRGPFKSAQIVQAGDVVVSHTDVTQRADVIGRAYRVLTSSKFTRLVASLDMAIVRPTAAGQTKEYLARALADERFRDHAYGYTNGTTVLHLSSQALPDYPHLVPLPEIVGRFTGTAAPLNELIDRAGLETATLTVTRDALLPKLLSGELRVPPDGGR